MPPFAQTHLLQLDFPLGSIQLWQGSIGSIPTGWFLCDGNNGTPDLRNFFVVGAGSTYDPADSNEDSEHGHDFTAAGHGHELDPNNFGTGSGSMSDVTDSQPITGTTDDTAHLPPYYSLAYIMKIS